MITLATLHLVEPQQVFDQAVNHMLTQKEKSIDYKGVCVYKNDYGLKCVGGCFIGDNEYTKEMEYKTWNNLIKYRLIPPFHADLIIKLQNIHDNQAVIYWEKKLKELAEINSFNFNFVQPYCNI